MLKIVKAIIMIFISCFLISGCVSTGGGIQPFKKSVKSANKGNPQDRFFISNETTPVDIKLINTAILNTLRHRGKTKFVKIDPAARQNIQKESFTYEGFDVILTDITGLKAEVIAKNKVRGILEGVFHFEDFAGRRASTYFAARYTKTPNGIIINQAGVTNISPVSPRLEAYFIPAKVFENARKSDFKDFMDMYTFALATSLDRQPTNKEMQDYQAYQKLSAFKKLRANKKSEKMKLAVMIFCFDRISNFADFKIKISGNNSSSLAEPQFINKDGWLIAVTGGEFVPDTWGSTLDINAYYTPEGKKKKLLIGKFSNRKNYDSEFEPVKMKSNFNQKRSPEKTPAVNKKAGSIASGSIFLDPRSKDDAKIIQTKLKELGLYKSKIDGLFGKGSKKALKEFKQNSGLENNNIWNLKTQKILFKNSGL